MIFRIVISNNFPFQPIKIINYLWRPWALFTILMLIGQLGRSQLKRREIIPAWNDTTFTPVVLHDTAVGEKIVIYSVGRKAVIYLRAQLIRELLVSALGNSFSDPSNKKAIAYLDSALLKNDSVAVDNFYIYNWCISDLLQAGYAKVYYYRYKSFTDTVYHRLERYGEQAARFFYLKDFRPFFEITEFSGIIDHNDKSNGLNRAQHYQEYLKEGEKIASLREE
jgi:hypothetical protein